MRIEDASASDLPAIRTLLQALNLPFEDLGRPLQRFLVARDGAALAGCVALEGEGPAALLRSLAVPASRQGQGLGRALHREALALARRTGLAELYLLTTTARGFFAREGWGPVDRAAAPAALQATPEFAALCPSTAVCMTRLVAGEEKAGATL